MSVNATIGVDDVSADIFTMEMWPEADAGRWTLILNNRDNVWGDSFNTNEEVELKINSVSMMKGYVDDVFPYLEKEGVYTNLIKIVGRNYGRDIVRLYWTDGYVDQKIDDIVDDLLSKTGSEIIFASPSAAPVTTITRTRTYLIDWFKELSKRINYVRYVDNAKTLHFYAAGSVGAHTSVDLKSIAGELDNNIKHLFKGEQIGFSIYNAIELSAGDVDDHWTDAKNAADYTAGANTLKADEVAEDNVFTGLSSIKFWNTIDAQPTITLDFSGTLFNHSSLDLSNPTELSFVIKHNNTLEDVILRFQLEDSSGNIIEFTRSKESEAQKGRTFPLPVNKFHKIQVTIGDSPNNVLELTEKNNRWHYENVVDIFDWTDIVKIHFKAAQRNPLPPPIKIDLSPTILYLDALKIPGVEVISLISDATSQGAYGKSMYFDSRSEVRTQTELDVQSADELEKRKDPLKTIKIIAHGQTGSKFVSQTLDVQAPGHGIDDLTPYRIIGLYHHYRKDTREFITEYDLVKNTLSPTDQVIDPMRVAFVNDPIGAAMDFLATSRRQIASRDVISKTPFGDTHPVIKLVYSGSGVAFPVLPEDGFIFKLTTDIAGPPVYYGDEGIDYQYDIGTTTWIREPTLLRRAATPPAGGEVTGDYWRNTTTDILYEWTGAAWDQIASLSIADTPDFATVEWPTDQLAIEMRPWTGNFSIIWDDKDDDPPTDWNHFKWGIKGNEGAGDATIKYADESTMGINFGQDANLNPDGDWYAYWDENEITGGDYDVQWTQDYSSASGVGKGLLGVVNVRNGDSESPSVMLYNTYIPQMGVGSLVAHSILSKHISTDWLTAKYMRTGPDVRWAAGVGTQGVMIQPLGIMGKDNAGVIQFFLDSADGKVYAGAGAVILDAGGITIQGQTMKFQDAGGTPRGTMFGEGTGALTIFSEDWILLAPGANGTKIDAGPVFPGADGVQDFGKVGSRWDNIYAVDLWGRFHWTDMYMSDIVCPKCNQLFEKYDEIAFVVKGLKDYEDSDLREIVCIPIHKRCDPIKIIRRWLECHLFGLKE